MAAKSNSKQRRAVVKLSSKRARKLLLKQDSYCTIELPPYFQFDTVIEETSKILGGKSLSSIWTSPPSQFEGVNHRILSTKDGRYAWRPLELIHPVLYVALVNDITKKANWKLIRKRFKDFSKNPKITCLSIPVESTSDESDRAELVTQWWETFEQKS